MRQVLLLFPFVFLFSLTSFGQTKNQPKEKAVKSYDDILKYTIQDTSIYGEMHSIIRALEGINYVTPINLTNSFGERKIPLREREGKEGILLEANLDFRFSLLQGRPRNLNFLRRGRLTFDYRGNFRMTLDESSPITPWSNQVGFGFDYVLFDSKKKWAWNDFGKQDMTSLRGEEKFRMITLTGQAHHYSNGQPPGVFTYSPDSTLRRNNYIDGDFSTNYFRAKLTWSRSDLANNNLMNISLAYRRDFGVGDGVLSFPDVLNQRYGRNRAEATFEYFSGPLGGVGWLYEIRIRAMGEYIIGNLEEFQPNLVNSGDDKYRFSGHLFGELRPLNHRSLGYMVHFFAGRDYMNIRYDDIIFLFQFGFTFTMNKYYPVGWKNKTFNKKVIKENTK